MKTNIICMPLSYSKASGRHGLNQELKRDSDFSLQSALDEIKDKNGEIKDIKVNHFEITNGEIWVQYTILYETPTDTEGY